MDEDEDADMKDPKNEILIMSLALPVDVLKKMLDLGILDKDDFEEVLIQMTLFRRKKLIIFQMEMEKLDRLVQILSIT